jgi:hypothetical protein
VVADLDYLGVDEFHDAPEGQRTEAQTSEELVDFVSGDGIEAGGHGCFPVERTCGNKPSAGVPTAGIGEAQSRPGEARNGRDQIR